MENLKSLAKVSGTFFFSRKWIKFRLFNRAITEFSVRFFSADLRRSI